MEKIYDFIVRLIDRGWTKDQTKAFFRRFIPIGTAEEMDKLLSLAEEKNLSREDLTLILHTITLNHGAEIGAMDTDTVMEKLAADFASRLDLAVHDTP